jgi:hypothetical protein
MIMPNKQPTDSGKEGMILNGNTLYAMPDYLAAARSQHKQ